MKLKLCKDCKHYRHLFLKDGLGRYNGGYLGFGACVSPMRGDVITGEMPKQCVINYDKTAKIMREDANLCGDRGEWWEKDE